MSGSLNDITVSGIVSRIYGQYVITADDGTEYRLSAIMPYEAMSTDFDSGRFALVLGKRVTASGVTDGATIWRAHIVDEGDLHSKD
ncbi:MAG: hypothetical protein EAX95_10610 [Candidatus Thorarchaeota archaeon]|nr:hypothetical protein [Candidatus Thorarchaeota archaeon]